MAPENSYFKESIVEWRTLLVDWVIELMSLSARLPAAPNPRRHSLPFIGAQRRGLAMLRRRFSSYSQTTLLALLTPAGAFFSSANFAASATPGAFLNPSVTRISHAEAASSPSLLAPLTSAP